MATKEPFESPVGMRRVCRRFERWRKAHTGRLPIPEALWAAAEAAREHGVFRTSKALRLEYGKLKRLAETGPSPAPQATFLELMPPQTIGLTEFLIELEGPHCKMRIQWKGTTAPDLAGLSRVLWESA